MTTSQSFLRGQDHSCPLFGVGAHLAEHRSQNRSSCLTVDVCKKNGCMESMQSVRFSSSIEIHDNGLFFREFADSILGAFFA